MLSRDSRCLDERKLRHVITSFICLIAAFEICFGGNAMVSLGLARVASPLGPGSPWLLPARGPPPLALLQLADWAPDTKAHCLHQFGAELAVSYLEALPHSPNCLLCTKGSVLLCPSLCFAP